MADDPNSPERPAELSKLLPLIREEWPQLEAEALEGLAADYERLVAHIAAKTEHTKALVRRQLAELERVLAERGREGSERFRRLEDAVKRLQKKSDDIVGYVRKQMLEDVKENPLVALLTALGLGILIGLFLRGGGRGRS